MALAAGIGPAAATAGPPGSTSGPVPQRGGTLLSWGLNSSGQLGNGSTVNSASPVRVSVAQGTAITAEAAGCAHSLALTGSGQVLAWGLNDFGQLGNGTETDQAVPVRVSLPAGTTVTAISAGCQYSLALTSKGQVLAWGRNAEGGLGDGGTADSDVPVPVALPAGVTVTKISAGSDHGLALTSAGGLLAWGFNNHGQLGNGTTTISDVPVPVAIPAGDTVRAVGGGAFHSLALTTSGQVLAWGDNADGELGDGSTTDSPIPVVVRVPAGLSVTAVSAGAAHSLALTSAGQALAWGLNNDGQLGNGTIIDTASPVSVALPAGATVASISAGADHSLALTTDGRALAWGDNEAGQLGGATTSALSATPVPVPLPAGAPPFGLVSGPGAEHSLAEVLGQLR